MLFLKCAKCLTPDSHMALYASVDLNDMLCDNCLFLFNEWCDTHPWEPYSNFIQPKPWPLLPSRRPPVPSDITPEQRLLWAIFGPDVKYPDETP